MATKPTKSTSATLKSVPKAGPKAAVKPAKAGPKPAKTAPPKISIVANMNADAAAPIGPKSAAPQDKAEVLKLKELLLAVVTKTGAKKKDVKDIVEATLAEMAAALGRGHSLALPPLGNVRVAKTQDKGEAKVMVLKLRSGGNGGKDGLADDRAEG